MKRMTKTEKVLSHLLEHGSITSWEAIQEYGATRLSAIIFTLKKKGYKIESQRQDFVDKFGDKSHFAKYIFIG